MNTHFCGSGETDSKVMIDHRYIVLSQQYIKLHKICSLQTLYIPLQSYQWCLYLVISVCMCTFYIPLQSHQWCLYLVISVCICVCVCVCVCVCMHACVWACVYVSMHVHVCFLLSIKTRKNGYKKTNTEEWLQKNKYRGSIQHLP